MDRGPFLALERRSSAGSQPSKCFFLDGARNAPSERAESSVALPSNKGDTMRNDMTTPATTLRSAVLTAALAASLLSASAFAADAAQGTSPVSPSSARAMMLASAQAQRAGAAAPKGQSAKRPTATDKRARAKQAAQPLPAIEFMPVYRTALLAVPQGVPEEIEVDFPLEGGGFDTLRLFRTSMRAPDAKLYLDVGGGELVQAELPPYRTYRGSLLSNGMPVSASVVDGELWALIPQDNGDILWIQPMSDFAVGRAANEHVIYRRSDLASADQFSCGVDHAGLGLPDWMFGVPSDPAESGIVRFVPDAGAEDAAVDGDGDTTGGGGSDDDAGDGSGGGSTSGLMGGGDGGDGDGGVAGASPFVTRIAFDADFEFFLKNGSNANSTVIDIENVMNNVSFVYDRDVNITYEYTTIVVRTTSSDPYTSSNMETLLCEFRTTWNTAPEVEITRSVAQLFTGKTIQGSVIGLAWLGVMCNQTGNDCGGFGNLAYSSVESRFTTISDFRTALSAHELGHNWQAQHCDSVNPCNVMCSAINACQGTTGGNLKFSPTEQNQIIAFRNAVTCDVALPAPIALPFSDGFDASSTISSSNWIYNKGVISTTAASNEPSPTRSINLDASSGNLYADDEIRSNFMLLGGLSSATVRYFVQHSGVEAGEQLIVEYLNVSRRWTLLNTITSDGTAQTQFVEFSHQLTAAAFHDRFRIRFRAAVDEANDDWFIDSVSVVSVVLPSNDECTAAIDIGAGDTAFDNTNATSSATALPANCAGTVGTTMAKDLWYRLAVPCTGTVSVSTCGTTGSDTRLAVYNLACPTAGFLVGCNNDAGCANGGATVNFAAAEGTIYYIRVGSNTTGGAGTLGVTCTPEVNCPGDANADGSVDGSDLAVVLGAWGTAGGDLNDDGQTDGSDLAIVLGAWGPCP
jgi:hypothetical protein